MNKYLLTLLIFLFFSGIYIYYSVSDVCRDFEKASINHTFSEEMAKKLWDYFESEAIQQYLHRNNGNLLKNYKYPSLRYVAPLEIDWNTLNISEQMASLKVVSENKIINEIGIGYGRAFLMYKKMKNGEFETYVDCKVYDDNL